jgi:redox-sensitive bicupin YhaK (pirin superfamily)
MPERNVASIVTAHQQREGAGFLIRRPLPTQGLESLDPFLMLDEVGPVTYAPGEALGAPDHPHRGMETVSYIIHGEKLHEDSTGKSQLIGPGDVQWMTAGAGIVHSEMPSARILESGGLVHSFQIWLNLPAAKKGAKPGYQHVARDDIPTATSADGKAQVTVIAGEAFGVRAAIGTHTPVWLQDWRLNAGASLHIPVHLGFNMGAYVFDGEILFGAHAQTTARGQMAAFGPGDTIQARTDGSGKGGRFLLLGGDPINEPVAWQGPFVMNTAEEITQAMQDYRSGAMGTITR